MTRRRTKDIVISEDLLKQQIETKTRPGYIALGGGLALELNINGSNYWKLKFKTPDNKTTRKSLGKFPDVSIEAAKAARDSENKRADHGYDIRKDKTIANIHKTIEEVFWWWYADISDKKKIPTETNQGKLAEITKGFSGGYATNVNNNFGTRARTIRRFQMYIFPAIGNKKIKTVTAEKIKEILLVTASPSNEAAHRLRSLLAVMWDFAIVHNNKTGVTHNIITPLKNLGVLPPQTVIHRSAPTNPVNLKDVLEKIDEISSIKSRTAILLSFLAILRPADARLAVWSEFPDDLYTQSIHHTDPKKIKRNEYDELITNADGTFTQIMHPAWVIPSERMKLITPDKQPLLGSDGKARDHAIPISKQMADLLTELKKTTGGSKWLFPSADPNRTITSDTLNMALRRADMTADVLTMHGVRAVARTNLADRLGYNSPEDEKLIRHSMYQLVKDNNGRAYDRTTGFLQRVAMMQRYADWLDKVRNNIWE